MDKFRILSALRHLPPLGTPELALPTFMDEGTLRISLPGGRRFYGFLGAPTKTLTDTAQIPGASWSHQVRIYGTDGRYWVERVRLLRNGSERMDLPGQRMRDVNEHAAWLTSGGHTRTLPHGYSRLLEEGDILSMGEASLYFGTDVHGAYFESVPREAVGLHKTFLDVFLYEVLRWSADFEVLPGLNGAATVWTKPSIERSFRIQRPGNKTLSQPMESHVMPVHFGRGPIIVYQELEGRVLTINLEVIGDTLHVFSDKSPHAGFLKD